MCLNTQKPIIQVRPGQNRLFRPVPKIRLHEAKNSFLYRISRNQQSNLRATKNTLVIISNLTGFHAVGEILDNFEFLFMKNRLKIY